LVLAQLQRVCRQPDRGTSVVMSTDSERAAPPLVLLRPIGAPLPVGFFAAATVRPLAGAVIGLSACRFAASGLGELTGHGWSTVPTWRRGAQAHLLPGTTELAQEPGIRTPA
jgi:hypothetical protein